MRLLLRLRATVPVLTAGTAGWAGGRLALGVGRAAAGDLASAGPPRSVEEALTDTLAPAVTLACSVALVAVLAWLTLATASCTLEALGRRSRHDHQTPRLLRPALLRRLVATAVGSGVTALGVGLVTATTATALPAGPGAGAGAGISLPASAGARLDGLPLPDRPMPNHRMPNHRMPDRPMPDRPMPERHGPDLPVADRSLTDRHLPDRHPADDLADSDHLHLVRAGDSLWRIAADELPGATPADLTTAWHAIHRANRRVVGADPDVLHPGTLLRIPAPLLHHDRRDRAHLDRSHLDRPHLDRAHGTSTTIRETR